MISNRVQLVEASPTMKVSAKAIEMKEKGIAVVNLSVGEPDFPTPQNIKNAAIKALENNFTKYTINAGLTQLRLAISEKLRRENNLNYRIDEIIVTNGAKQALFNAILSIINPGDEVIIPSPYWVSYPNMVKLAGGKPVILPTDDKTNFKITAEMLEEKISSGVKALILCNPSNPTGAAYSYDELKKISEVVLKHEFIVIADEIYEKLIYGNYRFFSFASLDKELKKRTILVNGVSKAYAMTGWRLGYAAAPAEIIGAMNKIQSHSTSNASSISQYAALEALTGNQKAVEEMRVEFEKRRDFLFEKLNGINGINCVLPEGAFYLFPNVQGLLGTTFKGKEINTSMDLSLYLLEEAKVAVVPGSAFGAEGYLRISYATSLENLKEAVTRIKAAVENLK